MLPRRLPSVRLFLLALRGALLGALLGLLGTGAGSRALAEDPPPAIVPDVSMRTLPEAAALLAESGLLIERWFEHRYSQGYPLGLVIQQKPRPGAIVRRGAGLQLMVMAAAHGSPEGRPADPSWPRPQPVASTSPPTAPPPAPPLLPTPRPSGARAGGDLPAAAPLRSVAPVAIPDPLPPPPVEPLPVVPPPEAPAPQAPVPGLPLDPPPASAPPTAPAPFVPLPDETPSGSPDAPAVAERATPGIVPELRGLTLPDAEQRGREAGLDLYVERVPGHPIGRVVKQSPDAGQARSRGSVVRVTVTAGGDFEGETAPAPAVDGVRVMVPDLLDRTPPQAERILTDLGLALKREEAQSGQPGRVVDQKPAAGSEVPKGSVVSLWITPPAERPAAPPTPAPAAPAPAPRAEPGPPPAPGPAVQAGVPAPIAPSEGTPMPKQRSLALGFSWLPVEGADAYVLELEEQGPTGWLPSVRKPARATATTVELERIAPEARDLRWRVRALVGGREGTPCAWVTLR